MVPGFATHASGTAASADDPRDKNYMKAESKPPVSLFSLMAIA
jgi:hypothetical protein